MQALCLLFLMPKYTEGEQFVWSCISKIRETMEEVFSSPEKHANTGCTGAVVLENAADTVLQVQGTGNAVQNSAGCLTLPIPPCRQPGCFMCLQSVLCDIFSETRILSKSSLQELILFVPLSHLSSICCGTPVPTQSYIICHHISQLTAV